MKNNVWQTFWKKKGQKSEWSQEDILRDTKLELISEKIETFLGREITNLRIIEIGAGRGLSAFYFGSMGANVTLLDNSPEAKKLAKEFWGEIPYKFVVEDFLIMLETLMSASHLVYANTLRAI